MFLNELIGTAKQLLRFVEDYELYRSEMRFWRNHYIDSRAKYDKMDQEAFIRSNFLRCSSKKMLEKSPEEIIKEIESEYEKIYGEGKETCKEMEKRESRNKTINLYDKSKPIDQPEKS